MKRSGVTLVEIMIAVLLTSLVLGTVYSIWSSFRRDYATANTRQQLQSETRRAIGMMAGDFKSMKAGTMNVNNDGTRIEFKRFSMEFDDEKFSSEMLDNVVYAFEAPILRRKLNDGIERVLGRNFEEINFTRGSAADAVNLDLNVASDRDRERAMQARMDISISAAMPTPITGKVETHSEKVSVFIRDEFYSSLNQAEILNLADLQETDFASISTDIGLLSGSVFDNLDQLTDLQLQGLRTQTDTDLRSANERLEELRKTMESFNTGGEARLGTLFGWAPLGRHDTELTSIQDDLKSVGRQAGFLGSTDLLGGIPPNAQNFQNATTTLDRSVIELQAEIDKYETGLLGAAYSGVNFEALKKSDRERYEEYKQAFELALLDKKLREAHTQEHGTGDDAPPYKSEILPDPSTIRRHTDSNGKYLESEADYRVRVEKTTRILNLASGINVDTLENDHGTDLRLYSTARDMMNTAGMMQMTIKAKFGLQENTHKINEEETRRRNT